MDDLVFSLRNVTKTRPGAEAFRLRLARLDVPRGGLLALVGPSGCGKSTALDMLACALRPDAPSVPPTTETPSGADAQRAEAPRFLFCPVPGREAVDVAAVWRRGGMDALARFRLRRLGYVLQTGGLLPFLTTGENIALRSRSLGIWKQRREAAAQLAQRLGIGHLLRKYPATLSVGERQRTAIAAALAHGPSVVLADEPTAALDPCHAESVLHLLAETAREQDATVLMVTHNPEQARRTGFVLVEARTRREAGGIVSTIDQPEKER